MAMKNKNIKSNYRIFKNNEGREFHINEEKLLQELQKHQSMREMSRKTDFTEYQVSRSSINRLINCCIGNYKEQPRLETVKKLGMALKKDEYAFLNEITFQPIENRMVYNDNQGIKGVFGLLNNLLYEIESSRFYNYKPNTEEDGLSYYDARLQEIREKIDCDFLGESSIHKRLYAIVDEEEIFIKSYSMPGVAERWAVINPRINYFDVVYDIINHDETLYMQIMLGNIKTENNVALGFNFYPSQTDIIARGEYFAKIQEEQEIRNLQYSHERLFQNELINTLRMVFKHDFPEYFAEE